MSDDPRPAAASLAQLGPAILREALERAFDYRGDVTLQLTDGAAAEGYLANRDFSANEPWVDLWLKDHPKPTRFPLSTVTGVSFTGLDTAAGRSWEAWLAKVAEAEKSGRIAELYPESLE